MNARKTVAALGFALGLTTMLAQFAITLSLRTSDGESVLMATVYFFGFLTNLANIAIVLVYAAELFDWTWLKIFSSQKVQASALATILLVALFYHFILLPDLGPAKGFEIYTDPMKHYLLPALYMAWWAIWPAANRLRLADLPILAVPAVIYPTYIFGRGALINDYPYAVINAGALGYGPALSYAGIVVVGFAAICAIVILMDKALGHIKNQVSETR